MLNIFVVNLIAVVVMIGIGLYTLLMAHSMLRMLIGYEILAKAVTLSLISAGFVNGKLQLSQALTITVIVLEVVFIAVAIAMVMLVHRDQQSLSIRKMTKLKG